MPTHSTLFIAHRGESYLAPENTRAAFALAWEYQDDAIELDVHLTRDGQVIVCHDEDTARITGGKTRLVISQTTAQALRQLDIGSWKDARYAGEKMPLLGEVLAEMPRGKRAFIEIKPAGDAVVDAVIATIKRSGRSIDQTPMISFHDSVIADFKERWPDGPEAYLLIGFSRESVTGAGSPSTDQVISRAERCRADGVDVQNAAAVDRDFIERIHASGMKCFIWTEDDPSAAKRYITNGADGITTNRARWLRDLCSSSPATA